jgi:hypothetical protein
MTSTGATDYEFWCLRRLARYVPDSLRGQSLDCARMLPGVELYLRVEGCGWSDGDYQRWLAALLKDQLLAEPEST